MCAAIRCGSGSKRRAKSACIAAKCTKKSNAKNNSSKRRRVAMAAEAPSKAQELENAKLPRLAIKANTYYTDILATSSKMLQHVEATLLMAQKCGEVLVQAKKIVGHGGWGKWLETNFNGSQSTATGYMALAEPDNWKLVQDRIAEQKANIETKSALSLESLSIRSALKMISDSGSRQ